jgi:hypothetical protein
MKKFKRLANSGGIVAGILALSLQFVSCMANFEDINRDNDKVPSDELNKDNLWAAYIQSMQQTLFAEDDNAYQRMDELAGNIYSGYHGEANYWGGNNSTTYVFGPNLPWNDVGFQVVYGASGDTKYPVPGVINSWNVMKKRIEPNSVTYAAGLVMKVAGMHRATDMYGPLPYTKYGETLYTEYDSQETIYKTFFTELDQAIAILSDYYAASPSSRPIAKFDLLFGSDIRKWVKFANSLKLRLAVRMRYVEPALAQSYAEAAVNHPLGVMEDNGDNAVVQSNAIYNYVNPLTMLWQGYKESKMGAPMDSYMNGYKDPRRAKYFSPVGTGTYAGQYKGARFGYSRAASYAVCSAPMVSEGGPLYFMTAAEIFFLRAEGAIEGWSMGGTAGELYNRGIETSMVQWGVSGGEVTAYQNNATDTPAAYQDVVSSANNVAAPSTVTIKWNDGDIKERRLERVITQKWIAMYPNGQEAWSEFRRTGYPKVFPPVTNQNSSQVPSDVQIRRIPLPISEKQNNRTIYDKAVADFFGGSEANDNPGTKLCWDAK